MKKPKAEVSDKSRVRRNPSRGHYDAATIYSILDKGMLCHLSFCIENEPYVIPTLYGRKEDELYIHGATTSRLLQALQGDSDFALCVTHIDGMVFARSAFHHSMNYRSVVLFGKAELITGEEEKVMALKIISDHLCPGRWEETRKPNGIEMKATSILKLCITDAAAKIRTGGPIDEKEDYNLDHWAGVVPLSLKADAPVYDELAKKHVDTPSSVTSFIEQYS